MWTYNAGGAEADDGMTSAADTDDEDPLASARQLASRMPAANVASGVVVPQLQLMQDPSAGAGQVLPPTH